MPEWPEMEHYRRLLMERIGGQRITDVEIARPRSINVDPETFRLATVGATVWYVEHRGKYLIFHLDNGKRLLLHLMVGGSLFFGAPEERPDRTAQITIRFAVGNLYFIGLRLGYLHLLSVKEAAARLAELGPDPMDRRLDAKAFAARFAGRRGMLKPALTDQSAVAGIGNCYADEMLHMAGIRPDMPVPRVDADGWRRLHGAMRTVLEEAAAHGGYMETPLYAGDTQTGKAAALLQVYDREGEPCPKCGGPIVKTELSGRKTFFCPACQPGT
jgi:formamidopyrimidine-DNA glycosylase